MLKRYFILLLFIPALNACETLKSLPNNMGTNITEADAAQAIRDALDQGVGRGIGVLNKQDGFFGNQVYKLLLPQEARKIETTLRQLGFNSLVDRAILQINRAAEDAVGYARPIFLDAIRQMTIADAINIIKGPRDAATRYFKQKTTDKLITAFTPIIKSSLDKFSATKYYGEMVNTYNGFPTTINKLNPDLPSYVVGRTVDALFDQVAQEESNIRSNPVARTTDIMKRVFGWASKT